MACTARAQETEAPTWELCPVTDALPLFQPLPEAGAKPSRENLPTDVSAEHLDVSKEKVTVLTGKVELRRGDQWLGTDQLTYQHDAETFATQGPVNASKGDSTPEAWMPEQGACEYATAYVDVAAAYALTVSAGDAEVLAQALADC